MHTYLRLGLYRHTVVYVCVKMNGQKCIRCGGKCGKGKEFVKKKIGNIYEIGTKNFRNNGIIRIMSIIEAQQTNYWPQMALTLQFLCNFLSFSLFVAIYNKIFCHRVAIMQKKLLCFTQKPKIK